MKKLLLLPVLTFLISLSGFTSKHPVKKPNVSKSDSVMPPMFCPIKSIADPSLSNSESVFQFTFCKEFGEPVNTMIKASYNGTPINLKGDNKGNATLKVKPGKYRFQFYYNENYYEIYSDTVEIKPGYKSSVMIYFRRAMEMIKEDKPVIYVYPTHTESVYMNLDLQGKLGFTYPQYDNGWNFVADPDGTIHIKDKKYNYLFWEGQTEMDYNDLNTDEGFIVSKDSLVNFFEEKLTAMGLNSKEIDDYITYWVPRMSGNDKNYIHFLFNEDYDVYAKLNVSPKPDQIFRVFMLWSQAGTDQEVIPQAIPSFHREGFTVVEWGGGKMSGMNF